MPAYKIIYGAGPTLTRDESRFGRGYGFVGMHREPAIKTLAYEVLERPLHGKNIFELDKGLARAGAELHSFQRMGDWWVFLRISAKQTESRLWSFEEFLLLDDAEVDALVARGISPVQVFRFDGEGSDGRPLWYRDPLWSEPATWYTEPLSFKGISFPDLVAEPSPGLLPFRYPTCSWIVPEFGDGASLPDLLNAFGLAGQSLRHKCYPGITREEFKELFWNRLSFTTYHLDPARVFDLNFATGKHQTWMAFWQGSHDPKQYETEEALSWPADEQSLPEEPSEDEMKAAGWLRVCPEEQTHPSKLQSDPIVSGSQHTNESYHERRPKSNKKQVWSNKKLLVIGGATFAFLLLGALVSFSYLRLKRQAERGERIDEIAQAARDRKYDELESLIRAAEIKEISGPEIDAAKLFVKHRNSLIDYLKAIANAEASDSLPSIANQEFTQEQLIEIKQHVSLYELLKAKPSSAQIDLVSVKNWLQAWNPSDSNVSDASKNLQLENLVEDADKSVVERARKWVKKYEAERSNQFNTSQLEILNKLDQDKGDGGILGIAKLLKDRTESANGGTTSSAALKEGTANQQASHLKVSDTKPIETTDQAPPSAAIQPLHITGITIERPDGVGNFKLPPKEFRETARGALVNLPLEHAKLWNGKIHLMVSDLKTAMAAARQLSISKSNVRIEGDPSRLVGSVSSDEASFKPDGSQPLVILEGGHLRVLQFPGSSFPVHPDYVAATDFLANEKQVADLIPVEEAPLKWAHLEATYGKGKQVASIDLPLPEGTSLAEAIAEALKKPANPASSDEAGNKAGAESFKRWFWDPPLTGKGGLLEGVQGLERIPHSNDKAFLGYSNKPCQLGATSPDYREGRTKIDTFALQIKGFPGFIGSPYHSDNTVTLTAITAQFLSEMSKTLYESKDDLLTSGEKLKVGTDTKFPNQYFPWDQNVILASMGKRQNLKELVKDFGEIAAGKATGFKETDYLVVENPVTKLPCENHQNLNKRFHELGKDLPQIAAFLEWADTLFPAGTTPAKERFEKALAEAIGSGEKEKKAKDENEKKLEAIAKGDLKEVKVKLILPRF